MKFFRLDLLTLLISLFILSSCTNPTGVGLGITPAQTLQANLVDTATINATTVYDDSVETNSITNTPLALFNDPVMGLTQSSIAASLNLPGSTTFTLPSGTITIDSARLVLAYGDAFYGDSLTTKYQANVYQLNEPLVNGKPYYSTKAWNVNSTLLGTKTFYARPKDTVYISDIVTAGPDTLKRVAPQVRIPIDPSFVLNHFFGATSSQLTTNSVFLNYIKGLYITLSGTTGGPGGIMYFAMGASKCSLDVYYRVTSGNVIDTVLTSLPVGNPHAVQISHTYPQAILNQVNNKTAVTASTIYLQGLSGLRGKISFPYLRKMLPANSTNSNVILNRAELVITPDPTTTIPFVPTPRLTLYRFDIAHQKVLIPDAITTDPSYLSVGSFGGFYDTYHKSYSFIITGYIQDLMRNTITDYGTYIAPADTAGITVGSPTIDISNSPQVAGRAVVGGNKTSPYKMKLNIIYNTVTK